MKNAVVLLLVFSISTFCFSEDTEKKDKTISIDQERKETLLYGIDSQVIELITTLTKEEISGFETELKEILETTYSEKIKTMIFEYFIKMEIKAGEDEAFKIFETLEYEDEYTDNYATAAINYLSEIKSQKASSHIQELLDNDNDVIKTAALKFIGNNNVKLAELKLLKMLEDDEIEDNIYVLVIKTLGEIKSIKALEKLEPILDDTDEDTTVRNAVCYSLGEIGENSSVEALKRALADRDNFLLRRSALEALSKFDTKEMDDILISSLRDNQWQIRYTAIERLAERKVDKSFSILKYKAENDPEAKIKKAALRAIGDINSNECRDYLKEIYLEKDYSDTLKFIAIEKLIEHNVDWIFPSINELYAKTYKDKRKDLLDHTLKILADKEYKYAADLYGKMLNNDENFIYQIYAIKGIRLNEYKQFKEQLEDMSKKSKNKSVKKHALAALEDFNK